MTWSINLQGHDDLSGDQKASFEKELVEKARGLADELGAAEGCVVSTAMAVTNTTGGVNLLN
jgi:hypothetical protein